MKGFNNGEMYLDNDLVWICIIYLHVCILLYLHFILLKAYGNFLISWFICEMQLTLRQEINPA